MTPAAAAELVRAAVVTHSGLPDASVLYALQDGTAPTGAMMTLRVISDVLQGIGIRATSGDIEEPHVMRIRLRAYGEAAVALLPEVMAQLRTGPVVPGLGFQGATQERSEDADYQSGTEPRAVVDVQWHYIRTATSTADAEATVAIGLTGTYPDTSLGPYPIEVD